MEETRKKQMRVLLFAGTFDPITTGHLLMLRQCIETEFFDEIWLLPSGKRTDKAFRVSDECRLEQCHIAIESLHSNKSKLSICDYEIKLGKNIDSYFTMVHFQQQYPEIDFYFFIGSDLLPQILSWPYGKEFVEITKLLVAYREGYPINQVDINSLNEYHLLSDLLKVKSRKMETSNASSTLARQQLSNCVKCDEAGTLHPEIMHYIMENSLYGTKGSQLT
ncbi:Cytidylyltransferase family protein [Babesia bovis T2Bo]|uniref:Cytidylyltransferase family protein n=1 Tax=Babesia bovis TaxID=5865 RepID=A7AMN0_BABBO|nr:Cytidylyltransferase family protein [Babesia bovis T2Bo]EDO07814.1 Cytidylyltransferase family protein [Babesia bovis T2Bo]|eukprot:XP_001611382.1 cytidylyltransferase family protein [Babesia bovis T2Bo]